MAMVSANKQGSFMRKTLPTLLTLWISLHSVAACGTKKPSATKPANTAPSTAASYNKVLLVALSQFAVEADGRISAKPTAARLEVWGKQKGTWQAQAAIEDAQSNVFHKALIYPNTKQPAGILTLGGMQAMLKLWKHEAGQWKAQTLWQKDFGGKFNRMRDAEVADLYNDGRAVIAVATHDQGVVALAIPKGPSVDIKELDQRANTFVHEIEIGDLNGDGVKEVYATPSEPNKLDGSIQQGEVVRYIPKTNEARSVVAKLGNRHAKEILVTDMNNDGKDELYVSVEAETEGTGQAITLKHPVEIRRFLAGTPANQGEVVATIDDRLCRFLTAGDIDGDGRKEMVAAAFRSGVWLLRPSASGTWQKELIDPSSSGFEHAALLADLDGDGRDELYVASDDQGELRQYIFDSATKKWNKAVITKREHAGAFFTWNLMPAPASILK